MRDDAVGPDQRVRALGLLSASLLCLRTSPQLSDALGGLHLPRGRVRHGGMSSDVEVRRQARRVRGPGCSEGSCYGWMLRVEGLSWGGDR